MGEEVKKKKTQNGRSTIGKITCEVKKKKKTPNHHMLFTAPDGWGYFWDGA